MKKLLFAVIIAAFTTSISAQTFGAKAGLNIANFKGDDTDDLNSLTSFHIGAVAEFEVADKITFQPELVYSMQGAKYDKEYVIFNEDTMLLETKKLEGETHVNYLNIPLMGKYYVTDEINLQFGPQIGFLMTAEEEVDGKTDDVKDYTKSIDFGINFGAGYKMDNGLFIDARYNLGLSDLDDERADGDDDKITNAVITLSVGYNFDF